MAESRQIYPWSNRIQGFLVFLSMLCVVGAVLRVVLSAKDWAERLDNTTLIYLGVAGGLLILRELKSFGLGDFKLEFIERLQQAEQAAAAAQAAANTAQDTAQQAGAVAQTAQTAALLGVGRLPATGNGRANVPSLRVVPNRDESDGPPTPFDVVPRGEATGHISLEPAQARNRILEAEVRTLPHRADLFAVTLRVSSTQPKADPLRGTVQFILHPSFHDDRPIVPVGSNGTAELNLIAWGAFPVRAVCDEGKTKLGLDLAELVTAPADFRSR